MSCLKGFVLLQKQAGGHLESLKSSFLDIICPFLVRKVLSLIRHGVSRRVPVVEHSVPLIFIISLIFNVFGSEFVPNGVVLRGFLSREHYHVLLRVGVHVILDLEQLFLVKSVYVQLRRLLGRA